MNGTYLLLLPSLGLYGKVYGFECDGKAFSLIDSRCQSRSTSTPESKMASLLGPNPFHVWLHVATTQSLLSLPPARSPAPSAAPGHVVVLSVLFRERHCRLGLTCASRGPFVAVCVGEQRVGAGRGATAAVAHCDGRTRDAFFQASARTLSARVSPPQGLSPL